MPRHRFPATVRKLSSSHSLVAAREKLRADGKALERCSDEVTCDWYDRTRDNGVCFGHRSQPMRSACLRGRI